MSLSACSTAAALNSERLIDKKATSSIVAGFFCFICEVSLLVNRQVPMTVLEWPQHPSMLLSLTYKL
jgi:hypothetical protein